MLTLDLVRFCSRKPEGIWGACLPRTCCSKFVHHAQCGASRASYSTKNILSSWLSKHLSHLLNRVSIVQPFSWMAPFSKKLRKTLDLESSCLSEKTRGFAALEFTHFFDHCGWFGSWSGLDPFFLDCWLDVVLLNFKEVMICWNRNLGNSTLVQSIIYIIHAKKTLHSKQMSVLSGIFLFSHFQLFPSFVTS